MESNEAGQAMKADERIERIKNVITRAFREYPEKPSSDLLNTICLAYIAGAWAPGEPLDPRKLDRTIPLLGLYRFVYSRFREKRLENVAVQLLIRLWEELHLIQVKDNTPIYGAVPAAAILSEMFEDKGDMSATLRWLLTLAASDVLYSGDLYHPVKERVVGWYGIPEDAANKLAVIALNNRGVVAKAGNWLVPEAFPEDVITKFLAEHQEYGVLFARHTPTVNEFPLSKVYFCSLLEAMDNAANTTEKGKTLEDLATHLTLLIPGWIPRRNVKTVYNEFESDIIVSNLVQAGNLNAELFGRNFLIECKNWDARVGVREVGYFLYRMKLTHTSFGILFASNGITGDSENQEDEKRVRRAATSLIHRAFNEDGNICVVITTEDLNQLMDGRSFWAMIVNKVRTVQYGESIYRAYS